MSSGAMEAVNFSLSGGLPGGSGQMPGEESHGKEGPRNAVPFNPLQAKLSSQSCQINSRRAEHLKQEASSSLGKVSWLPGHDLAGMPHAASA